ncbi:long-chain fatty acid--CoA ligase [Alloalcanivorax xenomutans]|jgi:fatty-acyl-CoA synthase|uniref:Long-chain fatty acid--CoA ligase n=1 Tax=Alloalcanivorax xenomutans TaxID=1094342 RepID=A0A9Q3W1P1_9GAMM|nr:long-chain fatty acid--CoA ligase [Alloalcanivorax xenomutans]ERS15089.1 long-chain fatty acid--CoA ligase [Alcanivorax sp. PN-3]KYZ87158.1 long-chain fatty acid--CoA ligase [Alcanivorax sp. KX64203]MBA4721618.1 long-chain fatty acid--CoA ligase [Alcanivorax sp.]ARB45345.1 long-chain fatty acid--CoA ligase [Alloalcanivorax xenomutans]MCE7507603.1 long-chain fatty acid--CoA ligase [Alloalcanivorax xenomutans]|tara:strand:- start:3170 stop:4846 length:1677 start_codon:yes stop_codon:yes gene_type:complete
MFDRHFAVWPENLPHHLTIPETSLCTNLDVSALRYPEKPAIIYYDHTITYRELKRQVDALAGYLQTLGVDKGDRVLLYMQNAPQFIIGYYAILRANAIVVPINPMNRTAELEHYLEDTQATVTLAAQEVFANIAPLIGTRQLRHVIVASYSDYIDPQTDLDLPAEVRAPAQPLQTEGAIAWRDAIDAGKTPGELLVGPDDLAVFPYSSGTTGAPKGCMHTHRSVMATCVHGVAWRSGGGSEGIILSTLPYFHVTGMQGAMNAPIYTGACIVLMTRWDRRTAATLIQRYQVTSWTNIVTMAIDLLSDPEVESFDLSSLQNIGGGGAAMPEAVSDKLFKLTGLRYIEGYGLSETIAATHINPAEKPKKQCLGIPVFDVDSRVIDQDTGKELGVGEVGEIISHGPQIFQGYWNRPEETEKAFIELDGKRFFRTGDMGYYDEEGYFFIVDRVKRMINASGFKVWPAEVESLMYRHPAIQECCIISAPHERRGETVKACVVLSAKDKDNVSEDDIITWCKNEMAAYKVPQIVEFRDELPRSPTGKVMWRALQEQEWAKSESAS